jgi:hypothetical protein
MHFPIARLAAMPAIRDIPAVKRLLLAPLLASSAFAADAPIPAKIEYNRDIRPLLADTCFKCHGFDKNTREADLRLDIREAAVAKIDDIHPIVPGKPDQSEVWRRITTKDEDDVMPPKKANRQLTDREKQVIRKWIEQGAEYQVHWAFIAPAKPAVPAVAEPGFSRNPIDQFVLARQRELGLKHVAEAERATLCRRLHLDILGLPPKQKDVDAFVNDKRPDAYERLVEQLLASEHFGERMAVWWLDLVRYADTTGYHSDNPRNVSPYRDYVIRAFNDNKRFDEFTIEQVAGDLLPGATLEQRIASAYNRLTLTTEEGGAQAKEYEAKSVTDRVKSIGTTWLGQTFMCAECHDHKFDPITTRDFYSMGAFFADIKEGAIGRREEGIPVPTGQQAAELARVETEMSRLQKDYDGPHPGLEKAYAAWLAEATEVASADKWISLKPAEATSKGRAKLAVQPDNSVLASGPKPDKDTYTVSFNQELKDVFGLRVEALPDASLPAQGPGRATNGNFVVTEVVARIKQADGKEQALTFVNAVASFEQADTTDKNAGKWSAASAIDGDPKGSNSGWAVLPEVGKNQRLVLAFDLPVSVGKGESLVVEIRQDHGAGSHTLGRFRVSATQDGNAARKPGPEPLAADIAAILTIEPEKRNPSQVAKLTAHHRSIAPELTVLRKKLEDTKLAKTKIEAGLPRCIVSEQSAQLRTVRILPRGDWMSDKGDIVEPATPHYLPGAPKPAEGGRLTRLDLGKWLVARENPLTSRVFVNRLWKQFYGTGLVKTLEDVGTQGELPVNQPLLDWLATDFVDSGWDVKRLVRLMVTSGIYRQSSSGPRELVQRDPFNRELARQSRWRLDAEFVRDNALSISGLIVHKLGGPSVKPYQPAGYWENLNFPTREWANDTSENQWRRGLYTWWQRSYVHPAMLAFDAPTREECAADRVRSNIPQQALVLLNDPQFVEAARVFAARMLKEGGSTPEARIAWAWREATGRAPKPAEIGPLRELLDRQIGSFAKDANAPAEFLKVGLAPIPKESPPSELAAYTAVARVILNLHETVTRF